MFYSGLLKVNKVLDVLSSTQEGDFYGAKDHTVILFTRQTNKPKR